MMKDKEFYQLKKEINEVKDLTQEILRRLGKLEFRGRVQYGEANSISQKSVSVDIHLDRMENGEFIRSDMKKQQDNWDKLKPSSKLKGKKIEIPKSRNVIKPNRKPKAVKHDELKETKDEVKNFQLMKIDEMEWLNLLNEIRNGFDAFQMGDFKLKETREQISSVIFNRVKKWLKNKEL